jgi:hypothetical protein
MLAPGVRLGSYEGCPGRFNGAADDHPRPGVSASAQVARFGPAVGHGFSRVWATVHGCPHGMSAASVAAPSMSCRRPSRAPGCSSGGWQRYVLMLSADGRRHILRSGLAWSNV